MKQILIFVLVCFCLISCDKYTSYTVSIDNQTNDTATIYFEGQTKYMQGGLDSVECLPNTNCVYFTVDGRYVSRFTCESKMNKDETIVVVSSGKTLTKEIWDSNNWYCSGSNGEGWKITFVITVNDLE